MMEKSKLCLISHKKREKEREKEREEKLGISERDRRRIKEN